MKNLSITLFIHPGRWELLPHWGYEYTWLCVTLRIVRRKPEALTIDDRRVA